ncbi:rRNA processing/ribosome biogenesis-domain-containing protein [Apiosordaria backusii]|uniref:Pre-rRNA-processing protein RIX1 n=1 Tax=Apiosordaria backusii TaxID=314023 RepID=A0AA40EZZ1_9PEZI|nr:rRNA processing/ribosome biogenesis-domain-containing protein [Apiosordaria backusii]
MAAPPSDLRVLVRRLASTPADQLPRLCPVLVGHVLRCGGPLSASPDAGKGKDKGAETPMLVHKLRTHITTLLTGRNASGRFAAVCLIKAVVDVGGWEGLRAADPWVRGLISVAQKIDPLPSKELAIITLTKIYMLLQGYPTLIREMATPTLPSFVTACLQLAKSPSTPTSVIDTVASSLSKLVMLYPTTLRPFAGQIKTALRPYIAPTTSDSAVVPHNLRESSRRLFVLLSYTAPKNGSSDEWVKSIKAAILDCHATADQIFRGVVESWESSTSYRPQQIRNELDPSGGGDSVDEFPSWEGIQSGSERLVGLLEFLAEYLDNPTKAPVTVPVGELLDLTTRLTLVTPPTPGSEETMQTNPSISRDEKAELWTVLPDIHTAVLRLHGSTLRRLGDSALPLSTDIIDHTVRVLSSHRSNPSVREKVYNLTTPLLTLAGPTLPRLTVDSLTPLLQQTCHDILLSAGHLDDTPTPKPAEKGKQTVQGNADAFLSTPSTTPVSLFAPLSSSHLASATSLLPLFLSHLPQTHLSPDIRSLLDRTAILSSNKPAMLASVLHPYKDTRGRYYPSILPFLVQKFGKDAEVEVVRSNLVRAGRYAQLNADEYDPSANLDDLLAEKQLNDEQEDAEMGEAFEAQLQQQDITVEEKREKKVVVSGWGSVVPATNGAAAQQQEGEMDVDDVVEEEKEVNPFAVTVKETETTTTTTTTTMVKKRAASPLKRKSSGAFDEVEEMTKVKRVAVATVAVGQKTEEHGDSDDSDEEGSVQIDMSLDDEDDEEDEDEDDE